MTPRIYTVISRSYDLSIRRTWTAELVLQSPEALVLEGRFESEVRHSELGLIANGTRSRETFIFGEWFNHFAFFEPDGQLRNHYFNVSMPVKVAGSEVDYVDLDIDVVVWPEGTVGVLDLDEFEQNSARFAYPADVRSTAIRVKDEILSNTSSFITRFTSIG